MNKQSLSERDICTKFITPNLVAAGWNLGTQIREEVGFTDGRTYVRGKIHARGARKRVDHILCDIARTELAGLPEVHLFK